jgi:cytochrome c-type biogenesis protein CcmH
LTAAAWRRSLGIALLALLPGTATSPALGQEESAANEAATAAVQQGETAPTDDRAALTDPEEAELDARAAEVAGELRCLVCRNQSVLESNAELSREMQALIRERLAAGDTPEEVKDYFVSRYGEFVLLQPRASGINLLVYTLPGVALLVGFLVARNRLKKWASSGAPEAGPVDEDHLAEDEEEWLAQAMRES